MNKFKEILKDIKFKIININFFSNKNKIKLSKKGFDNNTIIKYSKSLIVAKNTQHIEILSTKIKFFLQIMEQRCENFDSNILINNFKNTLFDISEIKENMEVTNGIVVYDRNNKTFSFTIDDFLLTNHELLHLATIDIKTGKSGFRNGKNGRALNEGYTQLLTERYFFESIGESYFFEVLLVKVLEQIIGQNNMEKYYFNLSVGSLIKELSKYESESNIANFIKCLDDLLEVDLFYINNPTIEQVEKFQTLLTNLCDFLLSCIENKINILLSYNQIDDAISFYTNLNLPESYNKINDDGSVHNIQIFDNNRKKQIENSIFVPSSKKL